MVKTLNLFNKTLVVGVIILFIGIGIIPSICGNNVKNNEDLIVTITTDKEIYYLGETVIITISVTNYGPDKILTFIDYQLADLKITKPNGKTIYQWAWHFLFPQALLDLSIKQGETKVLLKWKWYKLRDFYPLFPLMHIPVLPGKYYITGWMVKGISHPMIKGVPVEVTLCWFKFN